VGFGKLRKQIVTGTDVGIRQQIVLETGGTTFANFVVQERKQPQSTRRTQSFQFSLCALCELCGSKQKSASIVRRL
jgi:hypothetical protein